MLHDPAHYYGSEANALNNANQSVGQTEIPGGVHVNEFEAVFWSPTGQPTVLPGVAVAKVSDALAINDDGDSAGYSGPSPKETDAMLWSTTGKATDLANLLGPNWTDTEARRTPLNRRSSVESAQKTSKPASDVAPGPVWTMPADGPDGVRHKAARSCFRLLR